MVEPLKPEQPSVEISRIPEEKPEQQRPSAEVERPKPAPAALPVPQAEEMPTPARVPMRPTKNPELQRIEKVLEEGLQEAYEEMSLEQQKVFKQKGEEVASTIEALIRAAKMSAKKILDLIKNWLRLIPRVNKFFLEQEAKIKTDKIMTMAEEKQKTS